MSILAPKVRLRILMLPFMFMGFDGCRSAEGSWSDPKEIPSPSKSVIEGCRLLESENLPSIYDCTGEDSEETVRALVIRARNGLGFRPEEGPRREDAFFANKYFLAWIDRTGFAGKLNGLWALNNQPGKLDFALVDPTPYGARPVNIMIPGEDGDGRWARAYNGAEHYEMPRFTFGSITHQAGIREANHFTDAPETPQGPPSRSTPNTWKQCINADTDPARWIKPVGSNGVEPGKEESIVFHNESPLITVARFSNQAPACGSPFTFDRGREGPLHLYSGYVFYREKPYFDRIYRFVNHAPYPLQTSGLAKIIGGFVLTDWPHPHYLKQFQRYISWDSITPEPGSPLPYLGTGQSQDYISVRNQGSILMAAATPLQGGRALQMIQNIQNGEEDFGFCLCHVHGGFEFGGSVLASQNIAAAADGQATLGPLQERRIVVLGDRDSRGTNAIISRDLRGADAKPANHVVGSIDGDVIAVLTDAQSRSGGYLYFQDYLRVKKDEVGQAAFYLAADTGDLQDAGTANDDLLTIDLTFWDGQSRNRPVLTSRVIKRGDFNTKEKLQRFVLDFQVPSDGEIEPRIYWHNKSAARMSHILINSVMP